MADTIEIVQGTATVVQVAGPTGPQGPKGDKGDTGSTGAQGPAGTGIETLTSKGDLLTRNDTQAIRLGIGSTGQILKVAASGIPEWGAAPASGVSSVNGETGAVTITAASIDAAEDNHAHSFSDINVNGVLISGAGNANANGPYLYSGDFGDRGAYHKDKDSLIYWDGDAWLINVNGDDRYSSTQDVSFPYQVTSWSVLPGTGTAPAPTSNARLSGQEFEEIVGQRFNPTLRGDAAGKNVGTGANDVAAGNHTHGNLTNDGKVGTTANLPLKTGTNGVIEAGAFSNTAGSFCEGNDARLSDDRDPNLHAASHLPEGADELFDQSLNTDDTPTFGGLTCTSTLITASLEIAQQIEIKDGNDHLATIVAGTDVLTASRNYQLPNASGTIALQGAITSSGLTQSTARILGRTTASTGAVEEIQIGAGLSLSAGELSATSSGGIGGGTGATANAVLRASGTGGSTLQASGLVIEDTVTAFTSVTGDAGTDIITATGSAFANGQRVRFTSLTGGAGLNTTTNYFVINVSGATFQLSTTDGGSASLFTTNITAATLLTGHAVQTLVRVSNVASDTNSALVLSPKGGGAFVLGPQPDASSSGGNARGVSAVELQMVRTSATAVASGERAFIGGGANNTGSGPDSVCCGGTGNTASGFLAGIFSGRSNTANSDRSMAAGDANTSSGTNSFALGQSNTASATNSVALGERSLADRRGLFAHASSNFATNGDAQRIRAVLRCKTTTNAAVEMALDGSTTYLTIPSGKIIFCNIKVVGVSSTGATVATFERQYAAKNVGGTSSEVFAAVTIGTDNAAGTSLEVATVDAGDYIRVRPTGLSATIFRWVASVDAVEAAFGT